MANTGSDERVFTLLTALRTSGWRYLRRMGPYLLVSTGLFLSLAVIGMAVGSENAGQRAPIATVVPGYYADLGTLELFVHNGLVSLQSIASVLLFGLPAVFIIMFNGFVFGAAIVAGANEIGLLWAIVLLIPHGIFELPAIWLSAAVAFRVFHELWAVASGEGSSGGLLILDTVTSVALVYTLLAIAAVVEANVTYALYRVLAGA
jgi:stage II sporulation protein M